MTERIELRNRENIKTLGEKQSYKYLGILEAGTIKLAKMKENFLVTWYEPLYNEN